MSDHDAAMKSSLHQWIGVTAVATALACGGGTANAQTASAASQGNAFHAPPVFTSQNGALNIQISAKANDSEHHLHFAQHRQEDPSDRLWLRDL